MPNDNKKIETIDDLARLMQNEFMGIGERFDKRFDEMDERFDSIDDELKVLRSEVESIKIDLEKLELRLSQMAPNFDVEDLKKRLSAVEKKLGIS